MRLFIGLFISVHYGAAIVRWGRDGDVQSGISLRNDMSQLVEFVDNGMMALNLLLFCLCIANLEGLILCLMFKQEWLLSGLCKNKYLGKEIFACCMFLVIQFQYISFLISDYWEYILCILSALYMCMSYQKNFVFR